MSQLEQLIQRKGGPVFGVSIHTYSPVFVELAGAVGFDLLWVEMEHGLLSFGEAADLCRIAAGAGLRTMIRIPDARRENVLKAAEIGPDIIDLPMANTVEIAQELVAHARYRPAGERGHFGSSRAMRYGRFAGLVSEQQRANDDLCLMIQIETREALERVEELCRVPGIDALLVGPGDLSASLGVPGEIDHPTVREATERVLEVAHACGKRVATVMPPKLAAGWAARGMDVLFCTSDVGAMRAGLDAAMGGLGI